MDAKLTSLPKGISAPDLAYLRFRESERIGDNRRVLAVNIDAPQNSRAAGFENHILVFSDSTLSKNTGFNPDFVIVYGTCPYTGLRKAQLHPLYLSMKAMFPDAMFLHDIDPGDTLGLGIKTYENCQRQIRQEMLRRLSDKGIKEIIQEAFDNVFTNEFGHLFRKLFQSFVAGKIDYGSMFITPGAFLTEANSLSSSILDSKYGKKKYDLARRVNRACQQAIKNAICEIEGNSTPIEVNFNITLPFSGFHNPWNKNRLSQILSNVTSRQVSDTMLLNQQERTDLIAQLNKKEAFLHYAWPEAEMNAAVDTIKNAIAPILDSANEADKLQNSTQDDTAEDNNIRVLYGLEIPGRFDSITTIDNDGAQFKVLIDSVNRRISVSGHLHPAFGKIKKFADGSATYEPKPALPERTMPLTRAAMRAGDNPEGLWCDRECIFFDSDQPVYNLILSGNAVSDPKAAIRQARDRICKMYFELERFGWLVAAHTINDNTDIRQIFDLPERPIPFSYKTMASFINETANAHNKDQNLTFAGFPTPLSVKKIYEAEYYDEICGAPDTLYTYYIVNMTSNKRQWICRLNLGIDIAEITKPGTFDPVLLNQRLPKFMQALECGVNGVFDSLSVPSFSNDFIILRCDYPSTLTPEQEAKGIANLKQYAIDIRKEFIRFANYLQYKANDKSDRDADRFTSILTTTGLTRLLFAAFGG